MQPNQLLLVVARCLGKHRLGKQARVILEALARYGMIVADQGTSWFITGARDPRWDDEDLDQLKRVPGTAFEVVSSGPILKP